MIQDNKSSTTRYKVYLINDPTSLSTTEAIHVHVSQLNNERNQTYNLIEPLTYQSLYLNTDPF